MFYLTSLYGKLMHNRLQCLPVGGVLNYSVFRKMYSLSLPFYFLKISMKSRMTLIIFYLVNSILKKLEMNVPTS